MATLTAGRVYEWISLSTKIRYRALYISVHLILCVGRSWLGPQTQFIICFHRSADFKTAGSIEICFFSRDVILLGSAVVKHWHTQTSSARADIDLPWSWWRKMGRYKSRQCGESCCGWKFGSGRELVITGRHHQRWPLLSLYKASLGYLDLLYSRTKEINIHNFCVKTAFSKIPFHCSLSSVWFIGTTWREGYTTFYHCWPI